MRGRLPRFRHQFLAQQFRRLRLHHDFRLKVQPRGEAQIFVKGTRVTINTTRFAAAIRVDAVREGHIGAVVLRDQGP